LNSGFQERYSLASQNPVTEKYMEILRGFTFKDEE
jgi:hypothetical protein